MFASVKELPPSLSLSGYAEYSAFLMAVGRPKESLKTALRLQQAEPIAVLASLQSQIAYEMIGEYDQADVEYERSLTFAADSEVLRGTAVTRALGRHDGAALRKALSAMSPSDPIGGPINGAMLRLLDDPQAALAELRRIYRDPAFTADTFRLTILSQWAAHLGDLELSLEALRRLPRAAVGAPSVSAMFSLWRPVLQPVRRLPAFKTLVRELGLVDYWRASGHWGEFCRPIGKADFECA